MPKGHGIYSNVCRHCHSKPYVAFKRKNCEFCGFIPFHTCQLDIDHIDENHKNNNPENLQTLCANCHRLKTFLAKVHVVNKKK